MIDLAAAGIEVIDADDERYPARLHAALGPEAPPRLFVAGPAALLSGFGLAVVGPRQPSPAARSLARAAARAAVEQRVVLVSGGSPGIDEVAMAEADVAEGAVVGVLAGALAGRLRDPDERAAVLAGRRCLVSLVPPDLEPDWPSRRARDRVVHALARRSLVVAAGGPGEGTWEGAAQALAHGWGDVVVWTGAAGEPADLVERGARGVTDLTELFPLPAG